MGNFFRLCRHRAPEDLYEEIESLIALLRHNLGGQPPIVTNSSKTPTPSRTLASVNYPRDLMKRFLRCKSSRQYFASTGWTDDPNLATDFPNSLQAIEVMHAHRLSDMELVLQMAETPSHLDIALPLSVRHPATAQGQGH